MTTTQETGARTDTEGLEGALRERVDGEVRFDAGSRAAYSTDASAYREVPIGVVIPRTQQAVMDTVSVCREYGLPVLSRGGGTSLAGQCTNTAVVLDFSKYCNRLISVDTEARRCVVEPGIVLDDLNRQLAPHGLRFGPEPSTHPNCTLGGMIGNNACGASAQRTGKVVDNVPGLDVLLYDGTRFWCGPTSDEEYVSIARGGDRKAEVYQGLRRLRDDYADRIRERFPEIPRRVSGYNLDSLLPEHDFDVAGTLVGSEGTLVTVLQAELDLIPVLPHRTLVILGYPDVATAADAVPLLLEHEPVALEGLDRYLLAAQRHKQMNQDALAMLPEGQGFLMVQFAAADKGEADRAAQAMCDAVERSEWAPSQKVFTVPERLDKIWTVRESGLGATAHMEGEPDTWPGWEDSAVAPERLGDYLRDLKALFEEFDLTSEVGPSTYGHFGQGCVHTRIPFDLYTSPGVQDYRRFLERAADLVVSYRGSLSGEHGDGQARGELLERMFGEEIVHAFGELKAILDPDNRMNPGKVVHPRPLDRNLRLSGSWSPKEPQRLFFGFPDDNGSFVQAANRCVGVGRCRQLSTEHEEVMCPSYQVTRDEQHSTRGRARLLFEMMQGHPDTPVQDGWRSTEVKEALDLCLACKGCMSDCPADVDMATYKAEFLAHHYEGRLRPRADYALGALPLVTQIVGRIPGAASVVNALSHAPLLARYGPPLAGLEPREVPLFAGESLQGWWSRRGPRGSGERGTVLLWPDTFTNAFEPHVGQAAVAVLEDAGWRVDIPTEPLCCGLTWISTGQLSTAKLVLRRTLDRLAEHVQTGGWVVGLEPSCTAVFRHDAGDLFAGDEDAQRVKEATLTLAELLTEHTPGWEPPRLDADERVQAMAQVHCHQHAVMGWDADARLLEAAGVDVDRLGSGCCGLAGNFGFTAGHGEVSEACAERVLLPAVRGADEQAVVLADGFSCRTQIHGLDSAGREAVHLAELLAAGLSRRDQGAATLGGQMTRPEQLLAVRPETPGLLAGLGALAGVAVVALGVGTIVRRLLTR